MATQNQPPSATRTTEEISRGEPAELISVTAEAVEGPGAGAQLVLRAGSVTVGSAADCELVLHDKSVSRRHASLELVQGAVRVRDLSSRNGVFYLGARVPEVRVPAGASIRLGKTVVRFTPVRAAAPLSDRTELHGLLGHSVPMRQLFSQLEKIGPTDLPVLIQGETGTGKDEVGRALHALSAFPHGPFEVVDCTTPLRELELELFGHARRGRVGAVQRAIGGTLFLNQVGELALDLQPRLLQVLEQARPLGENPLRGTTARLVAATHQDLAAEVKAGRFREDLYYRLSVTSVTVPPLRDRPEDIPLLAQRFAREKTGLDISLGPATLAALQCDPWRGNVRELRSAVERVLALGSLAPKAEQPSGMSYHEAREQLLEQFEADYLRALLTRHRGNISAAAREADLSRQHFYRLLERHGLNTRGA